MTEINEMELLNQINTLRTEMIEIGLDKGLNDTHTIHISKQLDQLLFSYQLLTLVNRSC